MKPENWLWLLPFYCFLFVPESDGQQLPELLYSFPVPEQLAVTSDGQGHILLSTPGGEIHKYSGEGKLLHTYSPQSASHFTSIDARFTMQVRAFDENSQQIIYLDRFLNETGSFQLPFEDFNFISALGWPAAGNAVWVYNATDMQLKKWRTDTWETASAHRLAQFLNASMEVMALQEYQHKLYLLGTDRLLVFSANGSYEKKIALPEWKSVTFSGDELLILSPENAIEMVPLYTNAGSRQKLNISAAPTYDKILAVDNKLYFFTDEQVDVYPMITKP